MDCESACKAVNVRSKQRLKIGKENCDLFSEEERKQRNVLVVFVLWPTEKLQVDAHDSTVPVILPALTAQSSTRSRVYLAEPQNTNQPHFDDNTICEALDPPIELLASSYPFSQVPSAKINSARW
jgi:hypothetical protein